MFTDVQIGDKTPFATYADFYAWAKERSAIGQIQGSAYQGNLPNLVVLGRYASDIHGRISSLGRLALTDNDRTQMPAVMTWDDYREYFDQNVAPRGLPDHIALVESVSGIEPAFCIPRPQTTCARCGGSWTLDNCHDIDGEGEFEHPDFSQYAGTTLRDVQDILDNQTDGEYRLDLCIQNDRWIDLTSRDERSYLDHAGIRTEDTEHAITQDHVVHDGDKGTVRHTRFYHGACYKQHMKAQHAAEIEAMRTAYAEFLEQRGGFENVTVTQGTVPQRIIDVMLDGDTVPPNELAMMKKQTPYWDITTKQGSFAMVECAGPLFDLTKTGLTVAEVCPSYAPHSINEWLLALDDEQNGEGENTILRLCNALQKKQLAAQP